MRLSMARRWVAALGALIALSTLLVGVPMGLWLAAGWPLPHSIPSWSEVVLTLTRQGVPDRLLIDTLAVVCWLAWVFLAASVVVEVGAAVRGEAARRVAGPLQPVVSRLVAAIVVACAAGSRLAPVASPSLAAAAVSAQSPSSPHPAAVHHGIHHPAAPHPHAHRPSAVRANGGAERTPAGSGDYTVKSGDTLWDIADRQLGDPTRWPEVFRLNEGRVEPNGRHLTEPDRIVPGWALNLPTDAASAPAEPELQQGGGATPGVLDSPPVAGPASVPLQSPLPPPEAIVPRTGGVGAPGAAGGTAVDPAAPHREAARQVHQVVDLPSGGVVALSFASGVAAGLAMARRHARRRRRPGEAGDVEHVESLVTPLIRHLRRAHTAAHGGGDGAPASGTALAEAARSARLGTLPIGEVSGRVVTLDIAELSGIGLTGAGAPDAARALLAAFLTHAAPAHVEVMLAAGGAELVPGVDTMSGLEVVDGVSTAMDRLEVELVRRARTLDAYDAPDFLTAVTAEPVPPLPALLVITSTADEHVARQRAVVEQGRRLGICMVVLGAFLPGRTVEVHHGGSLASDARGGPLEMLAKGRLFSLGESEVRESLAILAAGRGAAVCVPPVVATEAASTPDEEPPPSPIPHEDGESRPVCIRVLGPLRVEAGGQEVTITRSLAREFLALLVVRPHGLTRDEALEALNGDPDRDATELSDSWHTAVSKCRDELHKATGRSARFITYSGGRYSLDPALFDADLWRFEAALHDARAATSDPARRQALERVARACGGELLEDAPYEWVQARRVDVSRRAADALCTLADLCTRAGDHPAAVTALEQAVRVDRGSEELHRRLVRLLMQLGRLDQARRVMRVIEAQIAELDDEPGPETVTLAKDLGLRWEAAARRTGTVTRRDGVAAVPSGSPRSPGISAATGEPSAATFAAR